MNQRTAPLARTEDSPAYGTAPAHQLGEEDLIIANAVAILRNRLRKPGATMSSPADVKAFLTLHLAELKHEEFGVMMLDGQHRLIRLDMLFRGTLTQTSVYPREVLHECLEAGAAAVILTHNHPSGAPEPSRADEQITQALKAALALVDVRVLDHIVVGGTEAVSFAERGLL